MSANVRCAGNPEMQYVRVIGSKATFANGGSCGWKGERRPFGYLNRSIDLQKPCPRCGGRVELVKVERP